jgi:FkbM family methyltransferase
MEHVKQVLHSALRCYMRCFPVDRGKNRVLNALWKPLSFGDHDRVAILRPGSVRVRCNTTQFLQRQLYFRGSYEADDCRLWMRYARSARTIFDVGANVGLYSLLAAASNPRADIHAFEPTPYLHHQLLDNIALNSITNIHANRVGVSGQSGTAFLFLCRGDDGSNEGMNFVAAARSSDEDIPVEVVTIAEYCRRKEIDSIDLVKLDIEGGEYDALRGAGDLLAKKRIGCLFVELVEWAANRSGHSTSAIKRLLLDAGYSLYKLTSKRLVPIGADGVHDGENIVAFRDPIDQELSLGEQFAPVISTFRGLAERP